MEKQISYEVFNKQTGVIVGKYTSKNRARTCRDKKDNEYGSYIHSIREVETK